MSVTSSDSILPGYARYQSPGQCDPAARRMVQLYWRDKRPDTVVYDPSRTTLSQSGLDSIRLCAARFDVAKLPADQLASMLSLAIWAQQPTLITQVMHRLREPQPSLTPETHAVLLRRAGEAFLMARPANLDSAVVLRDLMRPLEPVAGIYELILSNEITEFATHVERQDVAAASVKVAIALLQPGRMTADDRADYVRHLVTSQVQAVQVASRRPGITRNTIYAMFDSGASLIRHTSGADPGEIQGRLDHWRSPYAIFGQVPAPVHSTYLYGDTAAPSLPRSGSVTLVYTGTAGDSRAMPTIAALRRLSNRFSAQGFAEVYLTATTGFFFNQLLARPSDEAELTRKYFLDYLGLPGTLAIERSYFTTNRAGLRRSETPSNRAAYPVVSDYVNCEIIGKDGKVKFFGFLTPETERVFVAVINDALADHVTPITTSTTK